MINLAPSDIETAILDGVDRATAGAPGAGWTVEDGRCRLDVSLWRRLADLTPLGLGGEEEEGVSFLSLALIADRLGAALVALPLIDHVVALRLLDAAGSALLEEIQADGGPVALLVELDQLDNAAPPLALGGAIARWGVRIGSDGAVSAGPISEAEQGVFVPNIGDLPVGRIGAENWSAVSDAGAGLAGSALDERRTLAAAAIGGMVRRAMELGVEYAKERVQFGAPIGSFQAIAHGLADANVAADCIAILSQEAAWSLEGEPERFPMLSRMAYAHAALAGAQAVKFAMHVFGGYGNTPEYPVQAYFRSVRALTLSVGDRKADLRDVGRTLLARPSETPFQIAGAPLRAAAGVR